EGHDPADHADRLLAVLDDGRMARRMGRAGIAQSLRFSWDVTASEILSVYRELLNGHRTGRTAG
ncbi:MAG: D-inositol-3-phosphate glycosyltransferase, partial [Actinobacteria bacterium]|nr:D-inositol-3-phosphate glycosyltransferase [Actinomycetota bacterium]